MITEPLDYLIIDTAAGISEDVCSFTRSADEVIVVVCDEPTSITDAYALIKVLNKKHGLKRFNIIANMLREKEQGSLLFNKLFRASEQFLDVTLQYLGAISFDELVHKAIKKQQGLMMAYPSALVTREYHRIAEKIINWPKTNHSNGGQRFFLERLLEHKCIAS